MELNKNGANSKEPTPPNKVGDKNTELLKCSANIDDISDDKYVEVETEPVAIIRPKIVSKKGLAIYEIENHFLNKSIYRNEVTHEFEMDGRQLSELDINSELIHLIKFGENQIDQRTFDIVLNSESIPSINPFEQYIADHSHLKTVGNIDGLIDCIHSPKPYKYVNTFTRKWLCGVVASAMGTHCVTSLILTGGQSVGKTKFFRNILPSALSGYFMEGHLSIQNKDEMISMANSLLVYDDEYSGKDKRQYNNLKNVSSKEFIYARRPYGKKSERLKRYAVLCGSSNFDEILNDPSGNRRVLPMPVTFIDHQKMELIDKDELFMELVRIVRGGYDWFLSPEEIKYLEEQTVENKTLTQEQELIEEYFEKCPNKDGLTTTQMIEIIHVNSTIKTTQKAMGTALKHMGILQERINNNRIYPLKEKVRNV